MIKQNIQTGVKIIFIVFLYERITHTGSDGCMKTYTIQLSFPVFAITSQSGIFGYEEKAYTASAVWVGRGVWPRH